MGFFSSEAFLESAAEAFHDGEKARIGVADVRGTSIRTLLFGGGRALVDCPFLDYFEPVECRSGEKIPYAPRTVRGVCEIDAWKPDENAPHVAPFVDWSRFASFDDYVAYAQARFGASFRFAERKRRKLEREIGPVELVEDDRDPAVLPLAFEWKGAQYARTELVDAFASARTRALFDGLARRGALRASTLRAGGRIVALHLGALHQGRFLYWVPAHEHALSSYSPGTVLLAELLRASFAAGHRWFDFLLGDESYKLTYATHAYRVGPVGVPALLDRAWRPLREALVRPVRAFPQLYASMRRARRAVLERMS